MYLRMITYKIKDHANHEAAEIWREMDKLLQPQAITGRIFSSFTGDRPAVMVLLESESLDAFAAIDSPAPELRALAERWDAIRIPNSRHDQIWREH